jgi:hypothetical protein
MKREIGSWVIVRRTDGMAVLETFSRRVAGQINTDRYEAIPIIEYLQRLNASIQISK